MISGTFQDIDFWEEDRNGMKVLLLKQDSQIITLAKDNLDDFLDWLKAEQVKDKGVDNVAELINDLVARDDMTDWEKGFVASFNARIQSRGADSLSAKQLYTLERIHKEKMSKG